MIRVFISHSSKDKPYARELADFLEQDGETKVWLDEREIGPGQDFVSKIEEGIAADVTLLVLSPNSADSHWVETEWKTALTDNQPIATVWLEDCPIPKLLKSRDLFDLRQNRPEGMRRIKSWLSGQRKQPPPTLKSYARC